MNITETLQLINLFVTMGGVLYVIRVEHRFTKLETYVKILLQQWKLIEDDQS